MSTDARATISTESRTTHNRYLVWAGVVFALTFPSVVTWVYFVLMANSSTIETFSFGPVLALDPEEVLAPLPPLLDELLLLPHAAITPAAERHAMTTKVRRRRCMASTTFLALPMNLFLLNHRDIG